MIRNAGTLTATKVKKVKWCIYIAPLSQVSKALYNDQFTPSGLEAYTWCNVKVSMSHGVCRIPRRLEKAKELNFLYGSHSSRWRDKLFKKINAAACGKYESHDQLSLTRSNAAWRVRDWIVWYWWQRLVHGGKFRKVLKVAVKIS